MGPEGAVRMIVPLVAGLAIAGCGTAEDLIGRAARSVAGTDGEAPNDAPSDRDEEAGDTDGDAGEPSEPSASGEPDDDAPPEDDAQPEVEAACTDRDTALSPEPPDVAERVEETVGDLTGDGRPDRLITYAIVGSDTTTFHLRLVTASGYVTEVALDEASPVTPVRPLGAASLGGEREVAFVLESTGASSVAVSLWALHDLDDPPCAFLPVTIPDHTAGRLFPVGGSVGHASGLACDDHRGDGATELVVRSVEQASDRAYAWSETAWNWPDAGELRFVAEASGTTTADAVDGLLGLDCPGVEAP